MVTLHSMFPILKKVVDMVWVMVVLHHASILVENVPESKNAVATALLISSVCGRVCRRGRRVQSLDFPPQVLFVIAMRTLVVCTKEFQEEFQEELEEDSSEDMSLGTFFKTRFGFWIVLSLYATDCSQVILPMFFMVRPVHAMVVVFLALVLPR